MTRHIQTQYDRTYNYTRALFPTPPKAGHFEHTRDDGVRQATSDAVCGSHRLPDVGTEEAAGAGGTFLKKDRKLLFKSRMECRMFAHVNKARLFRVRALCRVLNRPAHSLRDELDELAQLVVVVEDIAVDIFMVLIAELLRKGLCKLR